MCACQLVSPKIRTFFFKLRTGERLVSSKCAPPPPPGKILETMSLAQTSFTIKSLNSAGEIKIKETYYEEFHRKTAIL